ncbi:MAG: HD-GYP domain-containing protein [Selenomonadaceae bacterium]|nr:HD-GYP domain-containing protein [Selenomonadaceae bacterium]
MVNVPIRKLRPGMITAQSIYNSKGGSYLTRGIAVNDQYIDRLKKLGVQSLAVTSVSPEIALPPPPDVVQEQTRVEAIHSVFSCFESMKKGMLKVEDVEKSSEKILVDVLNSKGSLVQLTDIRTHDTYTFAHSVNVAVLSAMLGMHLGFEKNELLLIIKGAMLHDIGKVAVPGEILTKAGRLTDNEMAVVRLHPEAGYRRIMASGIADAPILAKMAAQHHEHISGKGYPNRLMGKDIHPYSRIVALADVYDALTANRPYKQPYRPHVAHRIMTTCSVGQFDEELMKKFFNTVALYPVGTVMKTNFGYGIVRETAFGKTAVPTVILFTNRDGSLRETPKVVRMTDFPEVTVESVTEEKDLFPLILQLRVDPNIYLKADADSYPEIKRLSELG